MQSVIPFFYAYLRVLKAMLSGYDVGYLHKHISDKIDELLNEGYEVVDGKITDITENSGKFVVKVHIVLEDKAYL